MKKIYLLLTLFMTGCIHGNATCLALPVLHDKDLSAAQSSVKNTFSFYSSNGQWEKEKSNLILTGLETAMVIEQKNGVGKLLFVYADGKKIFSYYSEFIPCWQNQLLYRNFIPPPEI